MRRIFGGFGKGKTEQQIQVAPRSTSSDEAAGAPVRMTGTTTFGAENLASTFMAHGAPDGGLLELSAWLIAEPENAADPNAIAVHLEGARIGYLPGYLAAQLDITPQSPMPCQVQLWGERSKSKLRVIGWVAYGTGPVTWPHSASNPPPISTKDANAAQAAAVSKMVDDAIEGDDPIRRNQFTTGMVDGYHYLETVEPIKELKRQGKLEEALTLCYAAIDGAERSREGREPAPWYTIQAAIIHRKLGQRDQEIAVLERWLKLCPKEYRESSEAYQRLVKLRPAISDS